MLADGMEVERDSVLTAEFVAENDAKSVKEIIFRADEEACSVADGFFYSKCTVLPEDAQDKTLVWSSSDEAVATVDGRGEVRVLATGVVKITATAGSGVTGSYLLRIVEEQPLPVRPGDDEPGNGSDDDSGNAPGNGSGHGSGHDSGSDGKRDGAADASGRKVARDETNTGDDSDAALWALLAAGAALGIGGVIVMRRRKR